MVHRKPAKTSDRLVQHMAEFMYERLKQKGQIGWGLRAVQFLSNYVVSQMIERIHALGGEAVKSISVGDIVGLALHDLDSCGLDVVSKVDEPVGSYRVDTMACRPG